MTTSAFAAARRSRGRPLVRTSINPATSRLRLSRATRGEKKSSTICDLSGAMLVSAASSREPRIRGVANEQVVEAKGILAPEVGPVGPDEPLADKAHQEGAQPRAELRR